MSKKVRREAVAVRFAVILCCLSPLLKIGALASEQVTETAAIAASDGIAFRSGETLVLTAGGKRFEFQDGRCLAAPLPERHCTYTFRRHDTANRASLVEAHADEGGGYLYIRDSDGVITVLEDEPHLSPDGLRFIVVRSCEAPGGSFCGIQIWAADEPSLIWQHKVETYEEYAFEGWRGTDRVALNVWTYRDQRLINSPALLIEKVPGDWVFEGQ